MNSRITIRAGLPVLVTAAAFCATEVWNTKDPSVWTTEDANVVLNNSPWSKQIKLTPQGMGQRRSGMGRRSGGMGYPGGGYPGGGYPGGGYPGGGGGYPNGGGGYPGSGGGRGSGGTDGINLPSTATVRWESAKPVQEAEARLNSLHASYDSRPADTQADAGDAKAESKPSDHYVVSLLGIRVPSDRSRDDDDTNGNGKITNKKAYDQFMSTTQLVIKNKTPISPDNVKFIDDRGQSEIRFLFPKTSPITADDKEVTFETMVARVKVQNKFDLKKMTRNGKLELD